MAWPYTFANVTQANGSWLDANFNAAVQAGSPATLGALTLTATLFGASMAGSAMQGDTTSANLLFLHASDVGSSNNVLVVERNGPSGAMVSFVTNGGTPAGIISSSGSTTTYGTTSDASLKAVHGPADPYALLSLPVRECSFTDHPGKPHAMILAQEAEAVAPYATIPASNGAPCMIDHSKLVPSLLALVQALAARIEVLEGKASIAAPVMSAACTAGNAALAAVTASPVVQGAIARGAASASSVGGSNGVTQAQTL